MNESNAWGIAWAGLCVALTLAMVSYAYGWSRGVAHEQQEQVKRGTAVWVVRDQNTAEVAFMHVTCDCPACVAIRADAEPNGSLLAKE